MTREYNVGITPAEARTIASILSGRLKVRIREGFQWSYEFNSQTIYYRPADLHTLTEIDVVANLLHEAGHAKYSIGPASLTWPTRIPLNHQRKLKEIVNVIEDFRVEDKLRRAYPYAKNYLPEYSFKTLHILNLYREWFRTKEGKIPEYVVYCYGIYDHLAKTETKLAGHNKKVQKKINKTKGFAEKARYTKNTQEVADIIGKDIYPHIKDLLDDFTDPENEGFAIVFSKEPKVPIYEDLYSKIKKLIPPTKAKLAKILTDVAFDKFTGNFRSGKKLNRRSLYKFGIPKDKLFERQLIASKKDYVFSLVVDLSGSMHGSKLENAIKTTILFSHVLDQLEIPFSLHGFHAKIKHYKTPADSLATNQKKIFQKMHEDSYTPHARYNNDGQAIHEVSRYLLPYKKKKVMFVISDGLPAEDKEGMNYPLPSEIKKATRKGIKIVGIGIGYGQKVEEFYKTHLVVPEVENLPAKIIDSLKKELS